MTQSIHKVYVPFLALLVLLALSACAAPTSRGGGALTSAELSRLRAEQQELTGQVTEMGDSLELLKSQMAVQEMLIADLQKEMILLTEGAPAVKGESGEEPPAEEVTTLSPTEVYQRSFADYASGRYPQAVQGFEKFLRAFPDSRYAGNAHYWLAESYYAQQEFGKAIAAFEAVIRRYPQGGKAPEALYKLAVIHSRLRQQEKVEEYVERLQNLYPESSAAKKALKGEGF